MKKHKIFAIGFFLCGSFLYAELTKAQLWAISLPGILTEAREGYRNSLNDMAMDERGRIGVLAALHQSWDILSREQFRPCSFSRQDGNGTIPAHSCRCTF
jgi:hypothetical protein